MNFHNSTEQQSMTVTAGPTQNVNFQTTLVTLNLEDHNGNLITSESGTAGYYSGGWYTIGSTGTSGNTAMEFLPGSYYFNMNFHNGTQQIGAMNVNGYPWTQAVNFQTALVTVTFEGRTGTPHSGAAIQYYSGGWFSMGTTDANGNVSMEMLPVSYYYNATLSGYGTTQVGSFTDNSGGTPTHIIQCGAAAREDNTENADPQVGGPADFSVYPNPTDNGSFNVLIPIAYKTADITISDMTGKLLDQRQITDNAGEPVPFSLENLAKGIYIVKVTSGDNSFVTRVVSR